MEPEAREEVRRLLDAALRLEKEKRGTFLEKNASHSDILQHVNKLLVEIADSGGTLSGVELDDSYAGLPSSVRQFNPDEILAKRFKIVRFIAAGGMGEVYEAEDLELRELVAIKCISQTALAHPNALARFRREVHLARKVTHANVCRIFDIFRHMPEGDTNKQEIVFVSMELLPGDTLASRIRQKRRLNPEEALPLIVQVAAGLSAAHQAGIVHRDFKPGNVMLVPGDKTGTDRAVITDFGLALGTIRESTHTADLTVARGIVGTPAYMAPEQLEGRQATPATDIYSFGLVMYEMLTGVQPFSGHNPFAAPAQGTSNPPAPLKQVWPQLNDAWDETIATCLQRDPNTRFSSALDVVKALSDKKSISSDGSRVLGRRVYRRLRSLAAASLLVLVIAGIAYYFRGWFSKARGTTVHAAARPTVAVLGFKNLSEKNDVDWVSPALSQMLGTELTAGEQLRIIPSEQVAHGKVDLALPVEDSLGPDTLARVRNNLGSDFVILGSFLDMGGHVRIDVTLQNAMGGETIASISESGTEQDLPELAARAGERLRHKLGASAPSADESSRSKASQSSSLEATRLYAEGLEKLHNLDCTSARDLFERAIAADPNYALAHASLAECWRSLGYAEKSATEAKKAMDLSSGLSREDRLLIEAQYRNSTYESDREAEIYKALFTLYPDNLEYGFALAKNEYSRGQFPDANSTLDALQRLPPPQGDDPRIDHARSAIAIMMGDNKKALVLAQRVELRAQQRGARRLAGQALANQCSALSKLGEPLEAATACDKARSIFSEIGDYGAEAGVWGRIAFDAGNRNEAQKGRMASDRQIALLKKLGKDGDLAYALTVAGELSANSGDYVRASQEYNEALNLSQKVNNTGRIISSYGNIGWLDSLRGNLAGAVTNHQRALALMQRTNYKIEKDLLLDELGEALLDEGNVKAAAEQLEDGFRVNSETGDKRVSIYLHTARSRLLLEQAQLDESRREAELAIKLCLEIKDEKGAEERRLMLARLDIAQNHPQVAVEALRKTRANAQAEPQEDQIEPRALLIEALLNMPSADSKHEIAMLAKVEPKTPNVNLRLAASLQIARARFALGDRVGASELLQNVESESHRRGYECYWLEARLARSEMDLQSDDPSHARAEIKQVEEEAQSKGLTLIAKKAQMTVEK
jgi:serine/threonine protein kinase/TolB-like protein